MRGVDVNGPSALGPRATPARGAGRSPRAVSSREPVEAVTGAATAAIVLDELDAALGSAGEALVIVERRSRLVLWCSAACRDVYPSLRGGCSIAGFAELERMLDVLDAGGETASLPIADPPSSAAPSASVDASPEAPLHVTLVHAGDARVTLRFSRDTRSDDYLHRYVADREKLFMVSRTVSVSEMATTLAHELNQPIGAIANLLQGLRVLLTREHDELPEALDRALARASDQTRFAAGVIARVRSFTEARTPRLVPCDAGVLVGGTIELLDWVFRSEGVRVRLSIDDAPTSVSGDEILLQQVFANLLRNAVDAMRESPRATRRIDVGVTRGPDGITVEIRDSGKGLEKDAEDTLFVPFLSGKREGMGVGLSICRSFIEMHRGKLWLTPAAGGGCTAHVLLPERGADDAEGRTGGRA